MDRKRKRKRESERQKETKRVKAEIPTDMQTKQGNLQNHELPHGAPARN